MRETCPFFVNYQYCKVFEAKFLPQCIEICLNVINNKIWLNHFMFWTIFTKDDHKIHWDLTNFDYILQITIIKTLQYYISCKVLIIQNMICHNGSLLNSFDTIKDDPCILTVSSNLHTFDKINTNCTSMCKHLEMVHLMWPLLRQDIFLNAIKL